MDYQRIQKLFFQQDVLVIAPALLGKFIVCDSDNGVKYHKITEVEAYRGEEDLACHASRGRTNRNKIMYGTGGHLYVYLIYGMYWMLNIVTSVEDIPQAVLIRGIEGAEGPGKLTKYLGIDKSYYGEDLQTSERIWLAGDIDKIENFDSTPRIGIDYAGEYWRDIPWRFILQ